MSLSSFLECVVAFTIVFLCIVACEDSTRLLIMIISARTEAILCFALVRICGSFTTDARKCIGRMHRYSEPFLVINVSCGNIVREQ